MSVSAAPGEIVNLGQLLAEGGRIGIQAGLIRQAGTISADRAELGPAGEVYLKASGAIALAPTSRIGASADAGGKITLDAAGSLRVSGELSARGRAGSGGTVQLLGRELSVDSATVDASGARAGGVILVGGDDQGAHAPGSVANARTSAVAARSSLHADATDSGSGGKVIVWSDEATSFAGTISAKGGDRAGSGGRVEVSGKQALEFTGSVDTTARHGSTGTLLLDPSDITISASANSAVSAGPTFTGSAASSNLNVTTLQAALASNNVIVDTTSAQAGSGNIDVNTAVTWGSANSLELRAHNNINVAAGATITATGAGALRLIADQDLSGSGNVAIAAALTANVGGIQISGVGITSTTAGSLTSTGLASANAGAVAVIGTATVNLVGAITAVGGTASVGSVGRTGGTVTVSGATGVTTGTINTSGSAGNGASQAGGSAGSVTLGSSGGAVSAGAITASGGAGGSGNASGGAAAAVSLTSAGALTAGAIAASTGASAGTNAAGAAGSIALQGTSVSAGTLTTAGGANGGGGPVTAIAGTGLLNITGTINSSGGVANAGAAGSNAGNVALTSGGAIATVAVTASGSGSSATNGAGGGAGVIRVVNTGSGNIATGTLTVNSGAATGTGAGATPGGITLTNSAGNIQTGTLAAIGGTRGDGGDIFVDAAGTYSTTAGSTIKTSGGAASGSMRGTDGGDITITASAVTATQATSSTLMSATGTNAIGVADARGGHGGTISVTARTGAVNMTNGIMSLAGGNAVGNAAGGNGGRFIIRSAGAATSGGMDIYAGSAAGTGAGGTAGLLDVTAAGNVSIGNLTATGGKNSDGTSVRVSTTGNISLAVLTASGGAGNADMAGGNGGNISLVTTGGNVTVSSLFSASGGSGGSGAGAAGGKGGTVDITSSGNISLSLGLTASGGSAGGTAAAGGDGGHIALANTSTSAGTVTPSSLTARVGAAKGATLSGAPGSVSVTNAAPTLLQPGAINTSGQAGGAGGNVTLVSAGAISASSISVGGGTLAAGLSAAGRDAGSVTLKGVNRTLSGAITASGGSAVVAGHHGGAAGTILVTGSDGTAATAGTLTAGTITASTGASVGSAAGGVPGSVTLEGTTVTAGAVTTSGGANGAGGAVDATATAGQLKFTGAVTSSGGTADTDAPGGRAGNVSLSGVSVLTAGITARGGAGSGLGQPGGQGGNVAVAGAGGTVAVGTIAGSGGAAGTGNAGGGSAGSITLGAGGATIALSGDLIAVGGDRSGSGSAGSGGNTTLQDPVLLNASVSIDARGGGSGLGPGGDVRLAGSLDSSGGARDLTVSSNGITRFDGAVGASSPLAALIANGGGSVQLNGGSLTTTGAQTYANAVALGADTRVDSGSATLAFAGAVDGAHELVAVSTGGVVFGGAIGAVVPLSRLAVEAGNVTLGSATVRGGTGSAIDVNATRNVVVNGRLSSNGAPITLAANIAGAGAGSFDAVSLSGAAIDSGSGAILITGVAGSGGTGIVASGASSIRSHGAGEITLIADSVRVDSGSVASDAGLTVRPLTVGATLGVGSAASGTLGLSDATLATLSAGTLTLGSADTGDAMVATGQVFASALRVVSGRDVTLGSALSSSSPGSAITLSAGRNFINNAGAQAIDPGAGHWLVYSSDPRADGRGGLVADFKQYHTSDGSTPVLGTGNGFLYRIAPVLTPSLSGTVAKVYDAGSTATLAAANYSVAGAIDGDSVALAGAASYDSRHVGTGKLVSVSGLTIDHASNGAVAVYGYSLGSTEASGSIGTITAAPLSIAASGQTKVYDAGTGSSATAVVSGLAGSDSVSALTQGFDSANAGARTLAVTGYAVNDGNGGQNYVVTARTAAGTITPAPLVIGAASESKVYDASNRSSATPGLVSGLQGSDSVGSLAQAFDSRNAGSRTLAVIGYVVSDGNGGRNYAVTTQTAPGSIAQAPLTLGAVADAKVYDGSASSIATPVVTSGLLGADSVGALTQAFDSKNAGARTLDVNGYVINDGNRGGNYRVSTLAAAGAITPASLTIIANDTIRTTAQPNPALSASYAGFVGGRVAGTSGRRAHPGDHGGRAVAGRRLSGRAGGTVVVELHDQLRRGQARGRGRAAARLAPRCRTRASRCASGRTGSRRTERVTRPLHALRGDSAGVSRRAGLPSRGAARLPSTPAERWTMTGRASFRPGRANERLCRLGRHSLVVVALIAGAPAQAQRVDPGPLFEIQRFAVAGNTTLSPRQIDQALAPYAGPQRSFADVKAAAAALQTAYAAAGFGAVRIAVPEQQVGSGEVRLEVIESRLHRVTVSGNTRFGSDNIRRSLPSLREGTTPNTGDLSREIRLANENPSRRLSVELKGEAAGEIDAEISVRDEAPWKIGALLDNSGSPSTGRTRVGAFFQHANVGDLDHVATLQYITAPEHPGDVTIAALNYRVPVPALGDWIDLFGVHADVDSGVVGDLFNVRGRGTVAGIRYSHEMQGSAGYRHRWTLGLERRKVDNRVTLVGGSPELVPDVTVHPVSLGYAATWSGEAQQLEVTGSWIRNLPGGSHGTAADIEAARAGAAARYALLRYGISYTCTLPADVAGALCRRRAVDRGRAGVGRTVRHRRSRLGARLSRARARRRPRPPRHLRAHRPRLRRPAFTRPHRPRLGLFRQRPGPAQPTAGRRAARRPHLERGRGAAPVGLANVAGQDRRRPGPAGRRRSPARRPDAALRRGVRLLRRRSRAHASMSYRCHWSRRQESNLYLPLRRRPFYPLNYGERSVRGWREARAV